MEKVKKIKEFVEEHDNSWVADWDDNYQLKYCVYRNHIYGYWRYDCIGCMELPEVTYMSENCAILLVDKLNSGEITL
jgi:hypothetical protein